MKFRKRMIRKNATYDRCNTLLAEFLHDRSVLRRVNAQETEELAAQSSAVDEIQNEQVTLSEDILFKIFILLPVESLYRMQFVCKKWFCLINCSNFIRYHAHVSETVLICQKLALSSLPFDRKPKSYFHFLDLDHGSDNFVESILVDFVHILASCDGLVLATIKNKSLILANPVTRKHTELPLGMRTNFINESYSLAFCNESKTYKVVHLLFKSVRYIGCEIMNVTTREWKTIDGPSPDSLSLRDIKQKPVSIAGSLYWMPQINRCDYLVSMDADDEKFMTKKLPTVCTVIDRLVEIGGVLGLVTHATNHMMDIWILRRDGDIKEDWVKKHSINIMDFDYGSPIAICSPRNGKEMVFGCVDDNLYVYNFEKSEMKLVYTRYHDTEEWFGEGTQDLYIPHRNTIVSWEDQLS